MSEQQGTHFWFMALQTSHGSGYIMSSCHGTLSPGPNATRMDMFNEVRAWVDKHYPASRGGVVVAFDVQPNNF